MLNVGVDNDLNVRMEMKGSAENVANELLNVYIAVMETIFDNWNFDGKTKVLLINSMSKAINDFHDEWLKDGE